MKNQVDKKIPFITQPEAIALIEFCPESELLDLFGVHRTTLKRWRTGKLAMPVAARRLAWLVYGFQCVPNNDDWQGWVFGEDGLLYAPDMRDGFDVGMIRASYMMQTLFRSLGNHGEKIERLSAERDFYKSQCVLESKAGLFLMRIINS